MTTECCTENCSCNQKEPKDNEPLEEASKETDLIKRSDVVAEINRIKDGLGTARVFMSMSMDEDFLKKIADFCSMLDQLVLEIKKIKPAKDVAELCPLCSLRRGDIQSCDVPPDHYSRKI